MIGEHARNVGHRLRVLGTIKREWAETAVVPLGPVRLTKLSPANEVGAEVDPGFQWPASQFAAVTSEQPDAAGTGPLAILFAVQVSADVTKSKVRRDEARAAARGPIALARFEL